MARNKYPEETVSRILDVSMKLFLEKGYDHTTIQDIVDGLDVTKGAVYHHFKSKEDILSAALERSNVGLVNRLEAIRDDASMTGVEKLQALFEASISGSQLTMSAAMAIDPDPVKNSRLLGLQYQSMMEEDAPQFIEPIIRQGMEDGTIQTDQPQQMAEVLLLLANLWVSPMFRMTTAEELQDRLRYYVKIIHLLGANVFDNGISDELEKYRSNFVAELARKGGD